MDEKRQNASADRQSLRTAEGDWLSTLTPRELEVLELYLKLLNDKKVARLLGRRPQTIRNHLAAVEHKLGVQGRTALVSLLLSRQNNAE